jgi:cupredoxin-like protein
LARQAFRDGSYIADFYSEGRMRRSLVLVGLIGLLAFGSAAAWADDYVLTIKNHRFTPTELKVPANKRVQITVVNDDATPEEFESREMKVEKVIPGKSKGVVRIGPLKPGRYPFFGEFHEATAKGTIIAE